MSPQRLETQARIIRGGPWRMVIEGDRLNSLRVDEGFHRIVALMRLMNQMRFIMRAFLDSTRTGDGSTPSDRRQEYHSYFFTCALLFEGYPLAQRLAQHYRDRAAFKKGFAKLLADHRVRRFMADALNGLRNQAVFHADEKEIGRHLARANCGLVVVSGVGDMQGDTYYNLADLLTFETLIGACSTQAERTNTARRVFRRARSMMLRFLNAAELLIAEVVRDADPRVTPARLQLRRKKLRQSRVNTGS